MPTMTDLVKFKQEEKKKRKEKAKTYRMLPIPGHLLPMRINESAHIRWTPHARCGRSRVDHHRNHREKIVDIVRWHLQRPREREQLGALRDDGCRARGLEAVLGQVGLVQGGSSSTRRHCRRSVVQPHEVDHEVVGGTAIVGRHVGGCRARGATIVLGRGRLGCERPVLEDQVHQPADLLVDRLEIWNRDAAAASLAARVVSCQPTATECYLFCK
ncbi:uncharacterized protein B0T15DRAFT_189535 [Chaetomium strumarium]|uniref:Uncharacterized protein n=1 Tax=Chaetomium strumarium TaxID=1170767 RepID=A0AAJ0GS43_9PEZI|nr:hypothetical protein B0T15DRAFT_189535 [Chaetomium strumarium]